MKLLKTHTFQPMACLLGAMIALLAATARAEVVQIEVALQEGGEGPAVFDKIARDFEAEHPNIKVHIEADPRIADKLRMRILEKNFPEITNGDIGARHLIPHGDLLPLDDALGASAHEAEGRRTTWRDTFLPGTLGRYTVEGKTYAVPLSYYVQSVWFNKRLFAQHGWTPPKTWDELFTLCESMRSAGVTPFAFQGRYPYYARIFLDGAYYQLAGGAAFDAQKRLEAGTFDNPQMVQALAWTQTLATKYFQAGAMGMGHTEAQLQFFLGHTAMIPCGSWLKSEMAGKIPSDFELGTFNLPSVAGGGGDPNALQAFSGYYSVFSHSKHPAEAVEFLRYLTSRKVATYFCKANDLPVAIRDVNETGLSPELSDLATLIKNSTAGYGEAPSDTVPAMGPHFDDVLLELLNGRVAPAAAAKQLEAFSISEQWAAAHPDDLPRRHLLKPIVFLLLILGAGAFAMSDALRRRRPRSGGRAGPAPRTLPLPAALLFVGPATLLFAVFMLVPSVQSFGWSLLEWDGLTDATFVGLRHFRDLLFNTDAFWTALTNNLFIMFVIPLFLTPLSLFLAACVSRGIRGTRLFRSAFLLPSVMGGVATTLLWMNLYDPQAGVINPALVAIGHAFSAIGLSSIGQWFDGFAGYAWLSQDHLYTAIVPMSVWAGFGFNFILYLAAMQGVPAELYEAADLDGATPWQQFHMITLPMIWDVLTVSVVFLVIGGMKAFEAIWLLTNQSPGSAVHVVGTLVLTRFTQMKVGESTAIAVLLFAVVMVASLAAMRGMRREAVEG